MMITALITSTSIIKHRLWLVFSLLLILLPCHVQASGIVINELLPDLPTNQNESEFEWVELYNPTSEAINLTGFMLKDAKNNQLIISDYYLQDNHALIPPYSFKLVIRHNSKLSLNNDQDEISLFCSTTSAQPVDIISYQHPQENRSIGRYPDGSTSWYQDLDPTPGSANIIVTPKPSLPASATPTPNPTSSSLKSIANPTATPHTSALIETPHTLDSVILQHTVDKNYASPSSILGIISDPPLASGSPDISKSDDDNTYPLHSFFFMFSGGSFLSLVIYKLFFSSSVSHI